MYRNIYLEAYKNSTGTGANINELLCHFTYLYSTLGSVLQDIEFTVGKILSESPNWQPGQKTSIQQLKNEKLRLKMPHVALNDPRPLKMLKEDLKSPRKNQSTLKQGKQIIEKAEISKVDALISTGSFQNLFHNTEPRERQKKLKYTQPIKESHESQQNSQDNETDIFDKLFSKS